MIATRQRDGVTVLTLTHGKVNALDLELLEEAERTLDQLARDPGLGALILTGNGRAFSAGVDLFRIVEGGSDYVVPFLAALDRVLEKLLRFPAPTVAAINGHAIAGGCVLACACDHRLMAEGGARIGVPELKVGVPFPPLVLEVLRGALSTDTLQRLVLEAETIEPDQALAWGLVRSLHPPEELIEQAHARAAAAARIPRQAYLAARYRLRAGEPISEEEQRAVVESWCSDATRERIKAYLEATLRR